MDTSVGSDLIPEYSGSTSGSSETELLQELSKGFEEKGQGKALVTSTLSTAAKFQIRTAKEREKMSKTLSAISKSEDEKTDNLSVSTNNRRTELLRLHPLSPPSSDSSVTEERTSRVLNQATFTKDPELPICSGTSDVTTRMRGRTELRGAYVTNRSKSLEWRRSDGGNENETAVIRNTTDFKGFLQNRSESLEENNLGNSQKLTEPASPSHSVSLRIQAYNAIGQGMQNSNVNISPIRLNGGQSLPSRMKQKKCKDSSEDRKSPWWQSGQNSPKADQTEGQQRSPLSGPKVSEITGNQSILDRIGKLYGLNTLEETDDVNTRDSIRSKRYSAPVGDWFYSSDAVDSNLNSNHRRSTNDSMFGLPSSSSFSQWRSISLDSEKGGTLLSMSSIKDGNYINSVTATPSVLPNSNVRKESSSNFTVSPEPTCSKEKTEWNSKTYDGNTVVLRTHSLDRERSRNSATAISKAIGTSKATSYPSTPHTSVLHRKYESIIKNTERNKQEEKMTDISPSVKVMEASQSKQLQGPQECPRFTKNVSSQPKPQFVRGITFDCEKSKGNGDVFGSLTIPRTKRESSQEKAHSPSLDSVRSTIHKFEALALQNQSLSQKHFPRSFSVPEKPKLVTGVSKSNSDKSLSEWKGDWNTRVLRENFLRTSEVCEEVVSNLGQIAAKEKQSSNIENQNQIKTQNRASYKEESGVAQKLEDKSDQSKVTKHGDEDDINMTKVNRHADETDFSKARPQNHKRMEPPKENDTDNANGEYAGSSDLTYLDQKNLSASLGKSSLDTSDESLQEIPPTSKNAKTLQTSESIPVLQDSDLPSLVRPTLMATSTCSVSPSMTFSDSTITPPVQAVTLNMDDLRSNYNATKDEKVAAKVSRWITYEGDCYNAAVEDEYEDDDNDEGTERGEDSDSGESSVTITSNMSQSDHRSFSLSLVDLCNLGGLDYPPNIGNGSADEEKWMSRRSASLSSDISVLSSVTLLGTEELDCLLDDVKGLGDDALQNCEDVQVVVLHKEVGRGLGFTVAGGVDQNKPITVHRVFPYGAAGQEGSIQEGDQVLSINGTALHNSAHWEALRTVRKARGRSMAVVVLSRGNITETGYSTKDSFQKPAQNPGSRVRVTLSKSSSDLGFSLEGGVGSSLGDKALTVQRLFQGGPVGKVFPGDELLEVQGQSLVGLRRLDAWKLIKRLPPGPVEVLLQRPHLPQ